MLAKFYCSAGEGGKQAKKKKILGLIFPRFCPIIPQVQKSRHQGSRSIIEELPGNCTPIKKIGAASSTLPSGFHPLFALSIDRGSRGFLVCIYSIAIRGKPQALSFLQLGLEFSQESPYYKSMKNNNTTVEEYYENVMKAAKTLEEYYEKMANFTPVPENKKTYQMFRREMRDLWKTHAAY